MSRLEINLSDDLSAYLRDEAARRGFPDEGAFVQALLEAEKHRQLGGDLEALLREAAEGPFTDWTAGDVEDIRRAGRRAVEIRKTRRTR